MKRFLSFILSSRLQAGIAVFFAAVALIVTVVFFITKEGGTSASASASFVYDQNTKITPQTKLRLTFPEPMNEQSVLENLFFPKDFAAETEWIGNDLILKPKIGLDTDQSYEIRISKDAITTKGTPLPRDIIYRFIVAGDPKVSLNLPAKDAIDIPTDNRITIVFDRPVVPLTQVQGQVAEAKRESIPVTIEPETEGTWRWLGTSTFQFTGKNGLAAGTKYTVKIPVGVSVLSGDRTSQDFSFSFTTVRPKVESVFPSGDDAIGPGDKPFVSFNIDVDVNSARQSLKFFEIQGVEQKELAIESVRLKKAIRIDDFGKETEYTDTKSVVIETAEPLKFGTTYRMFVAAGLKATKGNLGLENDYQADFTTISDFAVKKSAYENSFIDVEFNNPIDNRTLKGNISIAPEVPGFADIDFEGSPWNERSIRFYVNLKPSTTYTVTLQNIRDQWKQALKEPFTFSFTTEKISPSLKLEGVKGNFGIFEKNQPPVFNVNSVNVSRLDFASSKLSFNEFLEMRKNNQSFTPQKNWSVKTKNKLDISENSLVDVEKEYGGSLQSGIYIITASAPEYITEFTDGTYQNKKRTVAVQNTFALTDMVITLKFTGDKALAWVTNMRNNDPVSGAIIKFHNLSGTVIRDGRTDKNGFYEISIDIKDFANTSYEYKPEFWVTAEKDGDFAFVGSDWNQGMEPNQYGIWENFKGPQSKPLAIESYVYTERPIYRAGDQVHFKGIVRMFGQNGELYIDPARKANVKISNPEGTEVFNKTFDLRKSGSFAGDFTLGKETQLGSYYLQLTMTPEDDLDRNYGGRNFQVLAYRTPEYKVDISPEKNEYFEGETPRMNLTGEYYFGAPMSGSEVHWRAISTDYYFNKYTDDWYSFSPYDLQCREDDSCERESEQRTQGIAKLDSQGHLSLSLPSDMMKKPISQIISVEADVTDENNQTISQSTDFVLHKSKVYIGVRSDNNVVFPNQQAKVKLIALKPDATPVANQKITVKLYKRVWNSIKKKGVDGEFYYDNEARDTFIRETTATTGKEGITSALIAVNDGGQYSILAEAKDSDGRITRSQTWLYVFSDFRFSFLRDEYVNWPHLNTDRIEVIPDKKEYALGDTAKILVKSPFQGANVKALVTVEREQIISKQVVNITSTAQPIEIAITDNLIPNAYISVIILKPRDKDDFDENGIDSGAPAFRSGYATLNVETKTKRFNIDIKPNKKSYLPGETVKVDIMTTDHMGKPISAEVSLGVVDMGVLALGGFELPDLVQNFYYKRGLGVQTAEMLTYLIERIKPGSKGGGGGDLERKRRGTFKDTAYWNPIITTNAEGTASMEFTLPDNLTTWHMLSIGHTTDNRFAANFTEIIETKRALVRTIRPRFAVRGDEVGIGALVFNSTDKSQNFEVSLQGTGFTPMKKDDPLKTTITVSAHDQSKVTFPIKVGDSDTLKFLFTANSGDLIDEVEETIPVKTWGVNQAAATFGVMSKDQKSLEERIFVPTLADAPTGKIILTVAPTLGTYLAKGLEYLYEFPYYCVEQTVSAVLGSVYLKNLQGFDAFKFVDDDTLKNRVNFALQSLYWYQRYDGGFGYFYESSRSYPYLSAYVYSALTASRKAGFTVDSKAVNSLESYLNQTLRSTDEKDTLDLPTRAYILFVLSENGKGDSNLASNLYTKRGELPIFAKAYLAMTYSNLGSADRAKQLVQSIVDVAKVDARGAHFEEPGINQWRALMQENVTTTALVMRAMVKVDKHHELLPRILRYLLSIRKDGHWPSTQSTLQTLLAFMDYMSASKELSGDFKAAISAADATLLEKEFNKANILSKETAETNFSTLKRGEITPVTLTKEGTGTMYYDMLMDYFYTPETILATDEGLGIIRTMTPVGDANSSPTASDLYKVTITITAPEDRHFVAVSSPLPAGFEAVDPSVRTSAWLLPEDVPAPCVEENNCPENASWYFSHTEYRDDEVFMFAEMLPTGAYQFEYYMRATTPGKFRYRPAKVYEMYFPETFGQTEGGWIEVKP